jgi:hypothetical protein
VLGVSVVYLGLLTALVGTISLICPLTFLGISTRGRGALLFTAGMAVIITGFLLPAREVRVTSARSQLDQFVPVYQFNEFHSIQIAAPREQVYAAIKGVTADEIQFFRTLTWIRRFGRQEPESILNMPKDTPLLDVATRTSFLPLAEEANRELVVGTLVAAPHGWRPSSHPTPEGFKQLHAPGFALAAMNFRVEETSPGICTVTTETRVYATDASARRRFAAYWRVIYPGSSLIRRMWLRAIARRAAKPLPSAKSGT